jgi:RimJ/RimL family protein N-acetyltransferase
MKTFLTLTLGILAFIIFPQTSYSSSIPPLPCDARLVPHQTVTDRVTLKKTKPEDLEIIYETLQIPEVVVGQGAVDRKTFFESRMSSAGIGRVEYTVFLDGKIIGAVHITALDGGLMGLPARQGETWVSIGYLLRPELWGQGLGTEIAEATFNLANRILHPVGFFVQTLKSNQASHKILTKLGFKAAGDIQGIKYFIFMPSPIKLRLRAYEFWTRLKLCN